MRGRLTITIPQADVRAVFGLQYGDKDIEDKVAVDFDVVDNMQTTPKFRKPHKDEMLRFILCDHRLRRQSHRSTEECSRQDPASAGEL